MCFRCRVMLSRAGRKSLLWTTLSRQVRAPFLGPKIDSVDADFSVILGGTAAAAGQLVRKLGGTLLGFVFMMELDFLKGREKLDAPAYTLLSGQEESSGEGKGETIDDKLPLGRTKESAEEANKSVADTGGSLAEGRP